MREKLIEAVEGDNVTDARCLLQQYAGDINDTYDYDKRALLHMCKSGAMTKLLLDSGAAVNQVDNDGWSALHWAASNGQMEVLDCLISGGAELNLASNGGETALSFAADEVYTNTMNKLLAAGAGLYSSFSGARYLANRFAGVTQEQLCKAMILYPHPTNHNQWITTAAEIDGLPLQDKLSILNKIPPKSRQDLNKVVRTILEKAAETAEAYTCDKTVALHFENMKAQEAKAVQLTVGQAATVCKQ